MLRDERNRVPDRGSPSALDSPERWARVKSVFCEAVDRTSPDRERFVADACEGDADLRREVESLLKSDEEAGSFIETPAVAPRAVTADSSPGGGACDRHQPRLAEGARLGPYEITSFVGAGGMSEVYRARDARLGRTVAIKILHGEAGDAAAQARLVREARHASTLSHPNVCTIHDVHEADGVHFIVMEYVEGPTLGDLIPPDGLPITELLGYGLQVVQALEHAHSRGIVHRDLKAANVVVGADGCAKLLDFGLARRLPGTLATASGSTIDHGALAGTLSHMAPEVLLGRDADARADIWALGVLLYQMAAGRLPFRGETPFATSQAILLDPAPPLPGHVPLALRMIIDGCLAKDPAERYQSAADVRRALEALHHGSGRRLTLRLLAARGLRAIRKRAAVAAVLTLLAASAASTWTHSGYRTGRMPVIAILPFDNASCDPAQAYFADGTTEAIIAELGRIRSARVISLTSVARHREDDPQAAGVALGADLVGVGSVSRAGERLRASLRLVETRTGRVRWTEAYDRDVRDVLAVQGEIVRGLASAAGLPIAEDAARRLAVVRAVRPEVYEAYLMGRYHWSQRTEPSLRQAVRHFEEALSLDATYAPAYAALADCYNQLGTVLVGNGSPAEWRPKAARAAIQALQIDPYLADAHAALGYVRHYNWEWTAAERDFRRALELNPSHALAHVWYANLLASLGRIDDALREVELARDLDPFSLVVNTNVGWTLMMAGRPGDAIVQLKRTVGLDPEYPQAHLRLGNAYMGAGRFEEGLRELEANVRLSRGSPSSVAYLAQGYALAGRPEHARELLRDVLDASERRYVSPVAVASVYVVLREADAYFVWMEKAFAERANGMAYMRIGAAGSPFRDDPRQQDLLRRVSGR